MQTSWTRDQHPVKTTQGAWCDTGSVPGSALKMPGVVCTEPISYIMLDNPFVKY